ncbi:MAG: hypothetical protein OSB70_14485 [Myxococcota bacterium]|nr:hypothetical protein [Myxococcota bacterium]
MENKNAPEYEAWPGTLAGQEKALQWVASRSKWLDRPKKESAELGQVYVLCLNDRIDRVRDFLSANGLAGKAAVLSAFTPQDFSIEELIASGIVAPDPPQGRPMHQWLREVCCSLGHMAIAIDSERSGSSQYLVFEDDLEPRDQSSEAARLVRAAKNIPWDFLYFSYSHADMLESQKHSADFFRLVGHLTTNAFAVRSHTRRDLIQSWLPIGAAIDVHLRDSTKDSGQFVLGANRRIFNQDRSSVSSQISADRSVAPPKWKPILRQKILARAHSFIARTGEVGYDETILQIDGLREGRPMQQNGVHFFNWTWRLITLWLSRHTEKGIKSPSPR